MAFFAIFYLSHYLKSPIPNFHWHVYKDLQDDGIRFLMLKAFRGSAKSTMASLVYALWCVLFKKRNFAVICSDTFTQSKQIIANIIKELEHNDLIKEDFGDQSKNAKTWTATEVELTNGTKIMARSRG